MIGCLPGFEDVVIKKQTSRILPIDLIYTGQVGNGGADWSPATGSICTL